jgi:DNA-binding transcriptional ArsR family regulator
MGTTKSGCYSVKQIQISLLLKAYGHPARVAIMDYLIKMDTCICGDIVNALPLAQPTISQHLKELKSAGLIECCKKGNSMCYCFNYKAIKHLENYFTIVANRQTKKGQL